ncbi:MAG: hypothetical protein EXR83_03625 [Gammaproteobacteria bacterium]|nr:hypothetical protein [Gammaproteobacteria bacterium]
MQAEAVAEVTPAHLTLLDSPQRWWATCGGILLLALAVCLPALERVPLESHEVLVAQTTREMAARGDWLLPYFNGVPRLNKPPLSYWLTGLVARLDGTLPNVLAWQARVVSALAAVGMVALTLLLGARLFDRLTAALAGLVMAGSAGVFTFAHAARPDMLYALCTSGVLVAAIVQLRRPPSEGLRDWLGAGAVWLAVAAATLCKGPQLPVLALLGVGLQAVIVARGWRAPARALRVLPGLLGVTLGCGSWWLVLYLQVDFSQLAGSQLAGALLLPQLARLGDPYYFYRPLQLLVPWLPLAVPGLLLCGLREARRDSGWLWWPLLCGCVGLSLGRQYRYFYLLALLLPLVLLLARAVAVALTASTPAARWARPVLWLVLACQVLLSLGCAGWLLVSGARVGWLTPVVLSLTLGTALGAGLLARLRAAEPRLAVLVALGVFNVGLWPGAALTGVLWSPERYAEDRLARAAAQAASGATPLVSLGVSPTLMVYAANRRVPLLASAREVVDALARSPTGRLVLVARSDRPLQWPAGVSASELTRAHAGGHPNVLWVLRTERPGRRTPP